MERVRHVLSTGGPPERSPLEGTGARTAAVLVALYEDVGETFVILTRRAAHLRSHRGEVSFPGGGQDPGEDLVTTALREAEEEINLGRADVEVIGELDHLTTFVLGRAIVPFVGVLAGAPTELRPSEDEVELILHVPLSELLADGVFREELWPFEGGERPIWFYDLVGDTVWGATARVITVFLARVLDCPELSNDAL